jgi:hypothetical protein
LATDLCGARNIKVHIRVPTGAALALKMRPALKETDCVAADAVRFELISASKLPDNRENTGNFA